MLSIFVKDICRISKVVVFGKLFEWEQNAFHVKLKAQRKGFAYVKKTAFQVLTCGRLRWSTPAMTKYFFPRQNYFYP